jgi:hypothetical protein
VIHVLFVFAVLNPLVMPFGLIYFTVEKSANLCARLVNALLIFYSILVVIKNQFLHVYAKNYEENGQRILIRIIRYSLDGTSFLSRRR